MVLKLISIVLLLLMCELICVQAIGVSPSLVHVENLQRGTSVEKIVYLSGVQQDEIITSSISGEAKDWCEVHIGQAQSSHKIPISITINVPATTPNGIYHATVELSNVGVKTTRTENAVSLQSTVQVKLVLFVSGSQVKEYSVVTTILGGAEAQSSVPITILFENTGNVEASPQLLMELLAMDGKTILQRNEMTIASVPPLSRVERTVMLENKQTEGSYWIHMSILDDEVVVWDEKMPLQVFKVGYFSTEVMYSVLQNIPKTQLGTVVRFVAEIENTGGLATQTILVAEIFFDNQLIDVVNSEQRFIQPGQLATIEMFYSPPQIGEYSITSYLVYAGKKSVEKKTSFVISEQSSGITGNLITELLGPTIPLANVAIPIYPALIVLFLLGMVVISKRGR